MQLTYFDKKSNTNLVEQLYLLSFTEKVIPFTSTILPIGLPSITFVNNKRQEVLFKKETTKLEKMILTSQFYNSYTLNVFEKGYVFGASFHPTALYKLLKVDMRQFYNKHIPLQEVNLSFFETLNSLFKDVNSSDDFSKIATSFEKAINNLPTKVNNSVKLIDNTIDLIRAKEGLLNVSDVLEKVPMSQKTLENQFKKIVGMTPGKYIRLWGF